MVVVCRDYRDHQVLAASTVNLENPEPQECQECPAEELAVEALDLHQHPAVTHALLDHPDQPEPLEIQVTMDLQARAVAELMALLVSQDPRALQDPPENPVAMVLQVSPVLPPQLAPLLPEIPDQPVTPDQPAQLDLPVPQLHPVEAVHPDLQDPKAHQVKPVLMEQPDQPDLPEIQEKPERKAFAPNTAPWTEEFSLRMAQDDKLPSNDNLSFMYGPSINQCGHFSCLYKNHLSYDNFVCLKVQIIHSFFVFFHYHSLKYRFFSYVKFFSTIIGIS